MALRAAIIGTGNIGTDLLLKSRKSNQIKVTHFIGRRIESPGIVRARSIGIATMTGGLEDLMSILDCVDHDHYGALKEISDKDCELLLPLFCDIVEIWYKK